MMRQVSRKQHQSQHKYMDYKSSWSQSMKSVVALVSSLETREEKTLPYDSYVNMIQQYIIYMLVNN
jgi:hypothetical protein